MQVFRLIDREMKIDRVRFLALAAISGLSNAGVLAIINVASRNASNQVDNLRYLIMFCLIIGLFVVSQKYLMIQVARRVEQIIHRLRVRLTERARQAELLDIEAIGRSEIFACISKETQTISLAAPTLVIAAQSAVLVVFTMLYIAYLSMEAFALSIVFTTIGAGIHMLRSKEIKRQLHEAYHLENRLLDGFTDMLDGFKEVKMSTARSDDIARNVERISAAVADKKIITQTLYSIDFILSQVTFFVLTGMMVFVVPMLSATYVENVVMTTTATLFMIGPISNVVGGVPVIASANAAAETIFALERRLSEIERSVTEDVPAIADFAEIVLDGLTFHHHGVGQEKGFLVGPVNLTIRKGTTVFITGGNGSGKTTLMRMLTGLYPAEHGALRLDRTPIDPTNMAAYRNLFAVIFSDNHLFKELYGLETVDRDLARDLFELLEMQQKAKLVGRTFDTISLSGGQRKRLALIAALLEKKPIYIFDEWAADQDPHFRQKFYRVILPRLRAEGKTIIAVTHDDKYFDAADVHLHMEEGRLHLVRGAP